MNGANSGTEPDFLRTLQQLGIVAGIPLWAVCWFWPILGNESGAYSGIDYVTNGVGAVSNVFFTGLFVDLVVVVLATTLVRG